MNYFKRNGFTLLEMLLVTAIMGVILVMVIGYVTRKGEEFRRDKAVTQIQQTLNAGLSFYTDNGRWPYCGVAGCKLQSEKNEGPGKKPYIYELAENGYLPDMHILNPWGGEINYSPTAADSSSPDFYKNFAVCITIPASDSAMITANSIAGRLPMAYTTADVGECRVDKLLPTNPCVAGEACTVVSQVTPPGQNLNNARSVNFTGIYRNGGCVPVPVCPGNMKPQIMVVPSSVSGLYDGIATGKVYPIESFTAYATPPTDIKTTSDFPSPLSCKDYAKNGSTGVDFRPCTSGPDPTLISEQIDLNTDYWRVCLAIVTEQGDLFESPNWEKESGAVVAITRCVPPNEPVGSGFDVFESF